MYLYNATVWWILTFGKTSRFQAPKHLAEAALSGANPNTRLRASLGNNTVELRVFDACAARYKRWQFDLGSDPSGLPAFLPRYLVGRQSAGQRKPVGTAWTCPSCSPVKHRTVLEVDGERYYPNGDTASPALRPVTTDTVTAISGRTDRV